MSRFKILLSVPLLLAVSTVLAGEGSGIYAGLGTGVAVNTQTGSSYRGLPFSLFAGYAGRVDEGISLAGEVGGNLTTIPLNNDGLRNTWSYGFSLLPGLYLSEHALGFLRVGVLWTEFSGRKKTGIEGGLGLKTALTREWDLRGEYDYIRYSGSIKTDQFAVGMVYSFT